MRTISSKVQNTKLVSVRCDRQANVQIDWDNIDTDGIHALCNEQRVKNVQFGS